MDVAIRAVQIRRKTPYPRDRPGIIEHHRGGMPRADAQRGLEVLDQSLARAGFDPQAVLHHLEATPPPAADARVALRREQPLHLRHSEIFRHADLEGDQRPRTAGPAGAEQRVGDALGCVAPHRRPAATAVQDRRPCEQQLDVVVELGHGAHRRARRPHGIRLVDGNGRGDALDALGLRPVHAIEKLPGIGREGLDVPPLSFGIDRVEGQRGLARAADAGDDHEAVRRQTHVDAFEIVLAGALYDDDVVAGHVGVRGQPSSRRSLILPALPCARSLPAWFSFMAARRMPRGKDPRRPGW